MDIQLQNRDYVIINEISRWRFLLSRQIRIIANFTGQRACDRRLAKLIEAGYIERKHFIYGVPSLYFVTRKATRVFNLEFYTPQIRVEQISHDIGVVDCAIYLQHKNNSVLEELVTERQLHHANGFGNPKHEPDFIFNNAGEKTCVELELSEKTRTTLEKNVQQNFIKYDNQIWFADLEKKRILQNLQELQKKYPMQIKDYEEVKEYVKTL